MNKILTIILLFISVALSAQYDSCKVLTDDQYFAISENVYNGDSIGLWIQSPAWRCGSATFSLLDDYNGAVAINSTTGMLSVADSTKINGTVELQDTTLILQIQTVSAGRTEIDQAYILLKETDSCIFVNYDWGGSETGARETPYSDLDNFTITPGIGVFLKRGVTIEDEGTILSPLVASDDNPTIIGAYGSGEKPTFDGDGFGSEMFTLGSESGSDDTYRVTNLIFSQLILQNNDYIAVKVRRYSHNIFNYGCDFINNDKGTVESSYVMTPSNYDSGTEGGYKFYFNACTFATTPSSHIKVDYGNANINLCDFGTSTSSGLRFASGDSGRIENTKFDIGLVGDVSFQLRTDDVVLENLVILNGTGYGIKGDAPTGEFGMTPSNITVKNVYARGGAGTAIGISQPSNLYDASVNWLIEDCKTVNCGIGYMIREGQDCIIRRCEAYDSDDYGLRIYDNGSWDTKRNRVYSSVFAGAGVTEVYVSNSDYLTLINNTIIGDVQMSVDTEDSLVNCIVSGSISGVDVEITNLESWSESLFRDSTNYDFRLKVDDTQATGQGTAITANWFNGEDAIQNEWATIPSVGAYENWGAYYDIIINSIRYKLIIDGKQRFIRPDL